MYRPNDYNVRVQSQRWMRLYKKEKQSFVQLTTDPNWLAGSDTKYIYLVIIFPFSLCDRVKILQPLFSISVIDPRMERWPVVSMVNKQGLRNDTMEHKDVSHLEPFQTWAKLNLPTTIKILSLIIVFPHVFFHPYWPLTFQIRKVSP